MSGDVSMAREIISFGVLRSLHLPSSRWAFSSLFLNGVFHGFYLLEEPIDEAFLTSRFPPPSDDSGHLLYRVYGGMRPLSHNPASHQILHSDFIPLTLTVKLPLTSVVLCCIVLCCIVLCCAVLCCVVLCCVVLCCVVLCYVVLCCIVLYCVVLYCVVFFCVLSLSHFNEAAKDFTRLTKFVNYLNAPNDDAQTVPSLFDLDSFSRSSLSLTHTHTFTHFPFSPSL
jgi:hypothetical protein